VALRGCRVSDSVREVTPSKLGSVAFIVGGLAIMAIGLVLVSVFVGNTVGGYAASAVIIVGFLTLMEGVWRLTTKQTSVQRNSTRKRGRAQSLPGWYAVPDDPTGRRWWDGSHWVGTPVYDQGPAVALSVEAGETPMIAPPLVLSKRRSGSGLVWIAVVAVVAFFGTGYFAWGWFQPAESHRAAQPVTYTSAEYGFAVDFPGEPTPSSTHRTVGNIDIEVAMVQWSTKDGTLIVGAIASPIKAVAGVSELTDEEVNVMLKTFLDDGVANVREGKLVSSTLSTLDGAPSINAVISAADGVMGNLILSYHNESFQMVVTGGLDDSTRTAFVNSFHWVP